MLELLIIRNMAVIDHAEIPFKRGLNILSGETGAGKSIVLEAIGLLLGGRGTVDLIRTGCSEASVEGLFDLTELPWLSERLQTMDLMEELTPQQPPRKSELSGPAQLIIRRVISRAGKSRIQINGHLANLTTLQAVCDGLIDICSQSEHQSLLKSNIQLELIDQFCGVEPQVDQYRGWYEEYRAMTRQLEELRATESTRVQKLDFLDFQIAEIQSAELQPEEDADLHREKLLAQSAESRALLTQSIQQLLFGAEADSSGRELPSLSLQDGLALVSSKLDQLVALDAALEPQQKSLEALREELIDLGRRLDSYLSTIEFDPARVNYIGERLHLLSQLKRKYGSTLQEVLSQLGRLKSEREVLIGLTSNLTELAAEKEKRLIELEELALEISAQRQSGAFDFARQVTHELGDLKMEKAGFDAKIVRADHLGPQGLDDVQFTVQTNQGESAKPIGRIASGGELSRLMLAIRRVIAGKGNIGVYLFDEIDTGISGQTAFQVGKKLRSVAARNQVICITHLPQVAAFAHHHLIVQKTAAGDRTLTTVSALEGKGRREEVARMLGGPGLTTASRKNAYDLLALAEEAASAG